MSRKDKILKDLDWMIRDVIVGLLGGKYAFKDIYNESMTLDHLCFLPGQVSGVIRNKKEFVLELRKKYPDFTVNDAVKDRLMRMRHFGEIKEIDCDITGIKAKKCFKVVKLKEIDDIYC